MRIVKTTRLLSEADGENAELTQVTREITPDGGNPIMRHFTIAAADWTLVDLTELEAIEQLALENNDADNFVQVALDDAGAQMVSNLIKSGDRMFWPGAPTQFYAKANTADVDVTVLATEYIAPV